MLSGYDVQPIRTLRDVFGDEIVFDDDRSDSVVYRIMAEFVVGAQAYAVLQSDELRTEGEVEIFRIARSDGGEPELETIEDDEEWETIAELYDEMAYPIREV